MARNANACKAAGNRSIEEGLYILHRTAAEALHRDQNRQTFCQSLSGPNEHEFALQCEGLPTLNDRI